MCILIFITSSSFKFYGEMVVYIFLTREMLNKYHLQRLKFSDDYIQQHAATI